MSAEPNRLDGGFQLDQTQRQVQTISPLMQESLRMLQMSALDLRAELNRQLETNPAIESIREPREVHLDDVAPGNLSGPSAADSSTPLDFTPDGAPAETILGAQDGQLDYFMGNLESATSDEQAGGRREKFFDSYHAGETLQDHLAAQIPYAGFTAAEAEIARMLISDVDGDGRYAGSFKDVEMVAGVDEAQIESVQRRILAFDPAGCCARDLRECLLAQLDKLDDSPFQDDVRKVVEDHLPDVAANRRARVCAALDLPEARYDELLAALRALDPKPGRDRRFQSVHDRVEVVKPEIRAVKVKGRWMAEVDARDLPGIRISNSFRAILSDPDAAPEAKAYVHDRLRAAEALLEAIDRRQETIRAIAQAIFDVQHGFFEKGPAGLKPLTRQQIADVVGVHNTTVARTVDSKWVACPRGVVPLRRFFSSSVLSVEGEVASDVVRVAIQRMIAEEDPAHPLSDAAISKRMAERGVSVARRTVAKYRSQLGIPGTAERMQNERKETHVLS